MAYTIKIHEKILTESGVKVIVYITDGTKEKWLDIVVDSMEELRNRIRDAITKETQTISFFNSLKVGEFTIPPLPPRVQPTDEERKLDSFNNMVDRLQNKKRQLDLGIATQEEYDALLEQAKLLK